VSRDSFLDWTLQNRALLSKPVFGFRLRFIYTGNYGVQFDVHYATRRSQKIGLPSRTIAWTVSSELIGFFGFIFSLIFRLTPPSPPNKVGLKCPSVRPYARPQKVSSVSMKYGTYSGVFNAYQNLTGRGCYATAV